MPLTHLNTKSIIGMHKRDETSGIRYLVLVSEHAARGRHPVVVGGRAHGQVQRVVGGGWGAPRPRRRPLLRARPRRVLPVARPLRAAALQLQQRLCFIIIISIIEIDNFLA